MSRLADPQLAERRRRQILDAAVLCFRRRGFHQATMQEICSEAGMSPGALYRYFSSKSEIIAAIAEDEQDHRIYDSIGATNETVVDFICRLARFHYERAATTDNVSLFADIMAEVARDPLLARSFGKLDERRVNNFSERIAKAQRKGEIDPSLDPKMAAQTLCAALEGITLRFMFHKQIAVDDALAQVRSLAERYLAPSPATKAQASGMQALKAHPAGASE